MKPRFIAAAIAGSLLLAGCSAGDPNSETAPSETVTASASPTAEPGAIAGKALDAECESTQEPPADFVRFMGECGGYDVVEFDSSIYGVSIDKKEALKWLSDAYTEAGRQGLFIVDDEWAIVTKYGETVKEFLKDDPSREVLTPHGEPRFLNEQIDSVKSAMKSVTGIDCKDKGKIDDTEITAIGCKKNGEYYAILGFFGDASSLEMALVEPKNMFRFAKRDTYILNGSSWMIYDIPESDAHQLQGILGGSVENLGEEPS